jgi:signal transduction histidine kinase
MARSRQHRKPSFLWQALLILLPVAVLAGVGFLSLRRDKILAQHEAVERAQIIADSLLPRVWSALTNVNNEAFEHHAFQVDSAGELLSPPPVASTPVPEPLDLSALTAEQASLWQQLERAEVSDQNIPAAIQAIGAFLDTKPPNRFAAVANYNLAVLLAKQQQHQAAADTLLSLLSNYPHAVAPSGLPLDRLADFKLLQLSAVLTNHPPEKALITADDFCRRIVYDPSPLTASFLSWISSHAEALGLKDGKEYWNGIWQEYEESRQLFESARSKLMTDVATHSPGGGNLDSQIFWFDSCGENSLAIRFDEMPDSQDKRHMQWKGPKGKMDLQPARGKNFLSSPEGQSDKVTLDNEPARIDPSRAAQVIRNSSRGTAERNGMSLPDFSGPAAIATTTTINPWYLCRTEAEISHALSALIDAEGKVPEYLGIAIDVGGKRLRQAAPDLRVWGKAGFFEGGRKIYFQTTATNVLASASYSANGSELLRVNVYLTSPATLFRRQSDRAFWFSSLVGASALAALIGLFSAWRAFNRQQELAEMKTNFVSSVSHELRAPIASVRLMAESLERGKIAEAPKQQEYFRFIGQECRRLSSLIENVLDFSRIEQGRKQYEFEPTDLLALLQQTVKLMESYGAEREVSIELKVPNRQPSTPDYQLSLDGRAIQQALINLLDNAIKHSPNGQTVSVLLECPSDSNASCHAIRNTQYASAIRISVIDHGPGIPPEEHEKIFERFYRLGSELRRETQGVGIGLSIVKHVVEAHGGRVLVHSAPGQGSRFTIELPITNSASQPDNGLK